MSRKELIMENIESPTKEKIFNENAILESCARKYCNKIGAHRLSVIYLDKTGLFCDECKIELEQCGLVYQQAQI